VNKFLQGFVFEIGKHSAVAEISRVVRMMPSLRHSLKASERAARSAIKIVGTRAIKPVV
jgi:hypothetical protein